jgi:UDP-N-acetylglucosamine--N-acetylmuramyl-(pentapeptide) pyrophosphoryl-undecaprenol N-acetylglucosamine transferase
MNTEAHTIKIIIAGGGTGGHIFPAIAIANAIKQQHAATEFLFVGAKGKMEMEKIPQAGYTIKGIDIAGFNRQSVLKNISLPWKLIKSFFQVKSIIKNFEPHAVIGVGGYSSFPVLRYAQTKHIPTFIHESNSFAGKSNILLGKKATKIFVAAEGMERFFPKNKIKFTGNPVRRSIVESHISEAEALAYFHLQPNKKTILITGGSLGAASINKAIANHLPDFSNLNVQLIWQTGKTTAQQYIQAAKPYSNVWANDFIEHMNKAYAAADVVVSRAGAMAVAELCVAKKAVVFVPYPYAAENHQTKNAMYLVERKAALMVNDAEVNEKLLAAIHELLFNDALRKSMEEQIATLAITNADEVIAQEILQTILPPTTFKNNYSEHS